MKKYKNILVGYLICLVCLVTGCVSQDNVIKNNNFSGIILDENNKPIANYYVCCYKNPLNKKAAYTNKSGIFFFQNMEIGTYHILGHKENYGKIENKEFYFNGDTSMFCCQVASLHEFILEIDCCIENRDYKTALDLTNQIYIEENQYSQVLVLLYKKYLNLKMGKMDAFTECVSQLKKVKNDKCMKFIEMELLRYE